MRPPRFFAIFASHMQHIEFFHTDHFENNYHRVPPPASLSHFIDFFWETKFDDLWEQHPKGFSDVLFPSTGYTYLINLGTPFIMQVGEKKFEMKTDGFLPRHHALECYHKTGNRIFGIKFRVSPVLFIKNINFSEYREYIFPLSYLLDQNIIDNLKKARSFFARVEILTVYFQSLIDNKAHSLQSIRIVTAIMDACDTKNDFTTPIETYAAKYKISARTLQRYFETCTGISSKKALQVMRIRKAAAHLTTSPQDFHYSMYGYYDHSHFYKHLKLFLQKNTLKRMKPHVKLLESLQSL